MSFSCRCKFSEYFVSELIPKKLFKCAFAKWLRSITSTEETGDSVDFCADQFETSTNPPPLLLGQTQGIEPSLVPGEWVIWPLPGWSGKFKPEMSSLTSLDNPRLTTWFDRRHLSHSNLRSWRDCFCVWEFGGEPAILVAYKQTPTPPLLLRGGGGLYTRYHSRGFATGSERRGYAGYSNSEMEEFKIKEQLFEANGLFSKVYFSNSQSAKLFFFERGIQLLHWANVTTRVACDNVSSFGSCPHESGDF